MENKQEDTNKHERKSNGNNNNNNNNNNSNSKHDHHTQHIANIRTNEGAERIIVPSKDT